MNRDDLLKIINNIRTINMATADMVNVDTNLRRTQIYILVIINIFTNRKLDVNLKMISKELDLAPATISPLVFELENMKYISRKIDAGDRRKFYFTVTKKGIEVLENIQDQISTNMIEYFELLSNEEFQQFLELSTKIADKIKERRC